MRSVQTQLSHFHRTLPQVVFAAESSADSFMIRDAAAKLKARTGLALPVVALLTGPGGKMAHVLNRFMTPVSHERLESSAAYVQTTASELTALRGALNLVTPLQYFIFGKPVSASPSPCMHNAAFGALNLPHVYHRYETDSIEVAMAKMKESGTGGASVTIPLKELVFERMDELTPAARTIGAVNTIIVDRSRGGEPFLIGHNTDWNGIMAPILKASPTGWTGTTALIVGAGGTSRAVAYGLKVRAAPKRTALQQFLPCLACVH